MKFELIDERVERAQAYAEKYKTMTLAQIAAQEGITRERVRQVMKILGISRKDGWRSKTTASRLADLSAAKVRKSEKLCQERYGCDWNTYTAITGLRLVYGKSHMFRGRNILGYYLESRINAEKLNIPWALTLPQFKEIVGDRYHEIGRGKLHFARKNKNGGFTPENSALIQHRENSRNTRQQASFEETSKQDQAISRMHAAGIRQKEIGKVVGLSEHTVKIRLYKLANKRLAA